MPRLLLALSLLLPGQAFAQTLERSLTLEDSVRLALLNDTVVLTAEQDKIISRERVREARFLFLPEVGLQASATKYEARYPFALSGDSRNIFLLPDDPSIYGRNTGEIFSSRAYMHLNIYEGRRTLNTLRLAQAAQKQAVSRHETAKMDAALSVKEVFYRLILAQEKSEETRRLEALLQDALGQTRLDPLDQLDAQARLADAREKASGARHELELARLSFLKGLNLEFDTPFKVIGTLETRPVNVDADKAVLWALELRPELQVQAYKAQMDAISVNLAGARRIPTLFLAGDYEVTDREFPLRKNNWDVTIGLRIPFSYDYWSQLRQKRAEQRQGQLVRAESQDRVRLEVRQAYETLQHWQREWPLRESHYKRALELFSQAGRGGSLFARARAQAALLDLKLSFLTAVAEHLIAQARLERTMGREIPR